MEYDENFRRRFPHLSKEIEECAWVTVKHREQGFSGYEPGVMDFLSRCSTDEEALEVVRYLEKRGEITEKLALSLRVKIIKNGVRSLCPKREWGFYK